jgi:hypothetical protein
MAQRINQVDKVQCAIRHTQMGTSIPALKRRYGVPESTVKTWIRKFRQGTLLKHHKNWQPIWDHKDVIQHPLDPDIVNAINRGEPTYEDSVISLFDRDLDAVNGVGHIMWTDSDIDKLVRSVFDRSLEILRDSGTDTDEFKEELKFVDSKFFFMICKAYGYDCDEVRKGIYRFVAERCAREEDEI